MQGPIVGTGAGADTLGMTSFTYFAAGSAIGDPDLGDYEGTLQWYNLMRGLLPRPAYPDGEPWINPVTGEASKFTLSGDPVLGSGWIDGETLPPGDRRIVMSSGPFTMAVGDTQDVVVGQISALGTSNLSSVSLLKFYDTFAQFAYDQDFDLPVPPATPQVEAVELDGEIILNWGQNEEAVTRTEDPISKGFRFEGYNVYQLPSATSQISEGVKVATFDILNNTSLIIEPVFDPETGFVVEKPTQQAPNEGIKRFIEIDRDNVRSRPLSNGVNYYFAVTAYSVLEGGGGDLPFRRLESSPALLTVTPQPQKPNLVVNANQGDTLSVEQVSGTSDGVITPIVVDPTAVSGDTYTVLFDTTDTGDVVWHLLNETSGDTLYRNQSNQSNDSDYPIVDGVIVKVSGPPPGFNNISEVAWGGDPVDPPDAVWHGLNSTADYFVSAGGGSGDMDRLTRYIEYAAPRDFEMRFTEAGGYGVYAFEDDKIATTPFELWDIGVSTPDDPSDDKRMIPFLNSEAGTSDSWGYATGSSYYFSGYPISDWVYWMDPFVMDPGSGSYDNFEAAAIAAGGAGAQYPYDGGSPHWGYFVNLYGGFVYPIGRMVLGDFAADGTPPPAGTTIRLVTNKPNGYGDSFQFTSPDPVSQEQITEAEVEDINVFPNPYYGYQDLETGRFNKFVTFTHLPQAATIRIFNLAGIMVRKIEHDSESQFERWDLTNQDELPVASGIYIAHVETESGSKVLKLAIVQEQQILQRY